MVIFEARTAPLFAWKRFFVFVCYLLLKPQFRHHNLIEIHVTPVLNHDRQIIYGRLYKLCPHFTTATGRAALFMEADILIFLVPDLIWGTALWRIKNAVGSHVKLKGSLYLDEVAHLERMCSSQRITVAVIS